MVLKNSACEHLVCYGTHAEMQKALGGSPRVLTPLRVFVRASSESRREGDTGHPNLASDPGHTTPNAVNL